MLLFEVIGNLGADARIEEVNGRKFVSFNVADSQRWTDAQGQQHESVQWISCAMDGDGGSLLPHLTKGRLVFVTGRGSCRVFSSPKTRRMEAGLNLSVFRIELLGGAPEPVPRVVYDYDGVQHNVMKYYKIDEQEARNLGAKKGQCVSVQAADGRQFLCDCHGWLATKQSSDETGQSQKV